MVPDRNRVQSKTTSLCWPKPATSKDTVLTSVLFSARWAFRTNPKILLLAIVSEITHCCAIG
ncbi:hypothetical protein D3C76_737150 [compost metagenome]|jgi:hypothetical protein